MKVPVELFEVYKIGSKDRGRYDSDCVKLEAGEHVITVSATDQIYSICVSQPIDSDDNVSTAVPLADCKTIVSTKFCPRVRGQRREVDVKVGDPTKIVSSDQSISVKQKQSNLPDLESLQLNSDRPSITVNAKRFSDLLAVFAKLIDKEIDPHQSVTLTIDPEQSNYFSLSAISGGRTISAQLATIDPR
jgi:DNA polymerase III sliding clamp (beta) subunit (PCNA family)